MTTALPLDFLYGTVRWTVVGIDPDSVEDAGDDPDPDQINGKVTFTPIFPAVKFIGTETDPEPKTVLPRPQTYDILNGRLKGKSGNNFVRLVANDSPGTSPQGWQYRVDYQLDDGYTFGSFFFSLNGGDDLYLTLQQPEEVTPGVFYVTGPKGDKGDSGTGSSAHTHVATDISDSSVIGRAVLTAVDAAAARAAIGAAATVHTHDDRYYTEGESDLRFAANVHNHAMTEITGSTATGRAVLGAADAATARTAIGAGTSSLVLGTTAGTAKAGDYTPPSDSAAGTASMRTLGTAATQAAAGNHGHAAAAITDATVSGRALLTAADVAAQRTALGVLPAVESSLTAYNAGPKTPGTVYFITS